MGVEEALFGLGMPKDRLPLSALPRRRALRGAAASIVFFAAARPALAFQLITATEAALPAGTLPSFDVRGSPTRLPSITLVSPAPGAGVVYSPLDFKLIFRAFGGAAIDPNSVVVTYIKTPDIDITPRIQPFITVAGIDLPQAQAPPGLHQFWIQLTDTDGRTGSLEFSIQVMK